LRRPDPSFAFFKEEKGMKKLRSLVIAVPFLLLMAEENVQAVPLSELIRSQYESRPADGESAFPATDKADSIKKPSKVETAGGSHPASARKPRQRKRGHARRRSRRRSSPETAAARARKIFNAINRDYTRKTHKPLVVTSFGRTEAQQANAIYGLIKHHKVPYVLRLYGNSSTIREIVSAYSVNRRHPPKAKREMTRVIETQVAEHRYVSKHLLGLAVDVRRHGKGAARLSVLRAAARKVGASVLVEPECFHLSLA
jgi:hypothetical protein